MSFTIVDKQGRGITRKLLDRLKWSDDNKTFRLLPVSQLNDNELMERLKLFLREILLHYPQNRIILVEVYRVHSYTDKEGKLHECYPKKILTERQENPLIDNEIINRGMACLKKLLPDAHCIPFPQNTLGDEGHPWGMSTMHYRKEYYDYAYRALRVITMGGEREKEKVQIRKMKLECEKKFKMLSGQITQLTENDCVDIDMELFRIIQKYKIYKDEPELQEIYYGDFATVMFNELVDYLDGDIAVRGDEISIKKFIQKLEEDNNQKIMAVIDDAPNASILDKITVPSSQAKNFDVIIITSKKLREQFIFESLRSFVKGDIKIVDIYDYLESKGIYYRNTFYDVSVGRKRPICVGRN